MSKSTFKILFYVRKNRPNKSGKVAVMIRITLNGEVVQFNSKLEIEPQAWNAQTMKIVEKTAQTTQLNNMLDQIHATLINNYRELEYKEANVTAEKVRNKFLGHKTEQQTLLTLFKNKNDEATKLFGISKSKATLQKYARTYVHMKIYIKSKYHVSDISLKEINHSFITGFETYLRTHGCNENTTAKFIQSFKRVILVARNNGWIIGDPFANYKIRPKRVDRGYLTEDEMNVIITKKMVSPRLENVKDIFYLLLSGKTFLATKIGLIHLS